MSSDGVEHSLAHSINSDDYSKTVKMIKRNGEYDEMIKLESYFKNINRTCISCDSDNLEYYDLKIDDWKLYDFDRLCREYPCGNLFQYTLQKKSNNISIKTGGSSLFHKEVFNESIDQTIQLIEQRESCDFIENDNGYFTIVLGGELGFIEIEETKTIEVVENNNGSQAIIVGQEYLLPALLQNSKWDSGNYIENDSKKDFLDKGQWSSEQPNVLSVTSSGIAIAKTKGFCKIIFKKTLFKPIVKIYKLQFHGFSKLQIINSIITVRNQIMAR